MKFFRIHLTIMLALVVGMVQSNPCIAANKNKKHDKHETSSSRESCESCASHSQIKHTKKELKKCCDETKCLIKDVDADLETCCNEIQGNLNLCGKKISIGQVDLPYTITQSGVEYCLREDVVSSFDAAITVASGVHDIILNMNLHTMQLTNPEGLGIAVQPDTSNVTIRNGRIQGNIEIVPPVNPGIPNYPGAASVIYTPNQNAIVADSSEHLTISDIATDTVNIGVILFTSNHVTVEDCIFKHGVFGMAVSSLDSESAFVVPTHNLLITDCELSDQAEFGIFFYVGDYSDITLRNLDVENNQSDGLFWNQSGGGSGWLIENVRCINNQGNGIHTQFYADNMIFNNCQFNNNLRNGMGIIGVRNCVLNNCQAVGNGLSGIAFLTRCSDTVELNNCQVVNDGALGNGGEIPLRFDMVRNLLINGCQIYSYGQPTIPDCDPEVCSLNNFPAVRIEQCYNVKMVDTLITLGYTDPENPGNGLLVRSSEGVEIENVIVDFGFLGGLDPSEDQANCFLVRGGVSNCRFSDCIAMGTPNNGFAVVWEHDDEGNAIYDGQSSSITFENCKAVGARNAGFYVNLPFAGEPGQGSVMIHDSESTNNSIGMQLAFTTRSCIVRDCQVFGNANQGIYDSSSGGTIIENCEISQNGAEGILNTSGGSTTMRNNVITQNGSQGIANFSGGFDSILNNVVSRNHIGIEIAPGTINCAVQNNNVTGNALTGIQDDNAPTGSPLVAKNKIYHNFANANTPNYNVNVLYTCDPSTACFLTINPVTNISN